MAEPQEPLWRVLRGDIDACGLSVRKFAKLLHEADPRQSADSWKRTLNRILENDPEKTPYAPTKDIAELLARLLDQPADRYVRPQQRMSIREENRRLKQELAELRAENDRLKAQS